MLCALLLFVVSVFVSWMALYVSSLLELTHDMVTLLFEIAEFTCFMHCTFQTYVYVNYANTVVYFYKDVKHINTARFEVIINVKDSSLLGHGI
jgi:hypothetical protein